MRCRVSEGVKELRQGRSFCATEGSEESHCQKKRPFAALRVTDANEGFEL